MIKKWTSFIVAAVLFTSGAFGVPYVLNNNVIGDGTFSSSIASGSNAFAVATNGARVDFGAGASDYANSDGTTVTFAGPLASAGSRFDMRSAAFTNFTLGTAGNATLNYDFTAGVSTLNLAQGSGLVNGVVPTVTNTNASVVGSGADTTEDNLMTYSLGGSSVVTNGKGVRLTAWGDGVSTTDATTVRCYFGATVIATKVLTISQVNTWRVSAEVLRTAATTQISSGAVENGGTVASLTHTNAAPAETLSGAVTIKCTGQRAVSSVANSVRQLGMIIDVIN